MKEYRLGLVLFIISILLFAGCGDDTVINVPEENNPDDVNVMLSITGLPDNIATYQGIGRQIPFTVVAIDNQGEPAVGIEIELDVEYGIGALSSETVTTDNEGYAVAMLNITLPDELEETEVYLRAQYGASIARHTLTVTAVHRPDRVLVTTATPVVYAREGEEAQIVLHAVATDAAGGSMSDIELRCMIDAPTDVAQTFGTVTGSVITDEEGCAEVIFNSRGGYGVVSVTVEEKIPNDASVKSSTIALEVRPFEEPVMILSAYASPNTLTVMNHGEYETEIVAMVRGENDLPLENIPLLFGTQYGAISIAPLTNSFGVTRATLRFDVANDLPEIPEEGMTLEVDVIIPGTDVTTSASVLLMPAESPGGSLALSADRSEVLSDGDGNNQFKFTAVLRDENGQCLAGQPVVFISSSDNTVIDSPVYTDNQGKAVAYLDDLLDDVAEMVEVTAQYAPLSLETSQSVEFFIFTEMSSFRVWPTSIELSVWSRNTTPFHVIVYNEMEADEIEGARVFFQTDIGVCDLTEAVTDANGRIENTLSANRVAGTGQLTIWLERQGEVIASQNVPIQIEAGPVNHISLSVPTNTVNRNESLQITAEVFDYLDNPIPHEFLSFRADQGTITPNALSNDDGVALVTYTAENTFGEITIEAQAVNRNTGEIISRTLVLEAQGLPPFQLDIDIGNTGVAVGGAAWELPVVVRVWDINGQPVDDGIAVSFIVDPVIAQVQDVVTGNLDQSGNRQSGVAHGRLVYSSQYTNTPVTVTVVVEGEQGEIEARRVLELPLQRGQLQLTVDPGNWMFREGQEEAAIRVVAELHDGNDIPINNAAILFTSSRAMFSWYDFQRGTYVEYGEDPVLKYTGVRDPNNNEDPGQATVYLIAEEGDIFLDPFTLEVNVQVDARVQGNDDVISEPHFIQFTRPA